MVSYHLNLDAQYNSQKIGFVVKAHAIKLTNCYHKQFQ